jgi:hypothetical protein
MSPGIPGNEEKLEMNSRPIEDRQSDGRLTGGMIMLRINKLFLL